ncbi:tetratricopeptide repeat protein [Streptomyces sp. NPDC090077]|uniref:tetratricopeptide repeat protein n=1 Tax=Streptomyces sp. NPDC090077 TaxID=3365938 RepID=UPI00382E71C1
MLHHFIAHDEGLRMIPADRDHLTAAVEGLRAELRGLSGEEDADRRRVLSRWIGVGSVVLGDYAEARTLLRQALDLATASGNSHAAIATEINLGDAYRYGGDADSADAFYRRALDMSRSRHPELVDFALQHYGKHLMERGEFAAARAHIQEALQLRHAKGDAALIEATQSVMDRVELLISRAEEVQWSRQWTSWLQSHTTARTPAGWEDGFPALREAVGGLTAHQRVQPRHLRAQFPVELLGAMTEEAEKAIAADGCLHNGKWNAAVGDAAHHFAAHADLAAVAARATGLNVEQPHTGVYIAYLEEGQFLDFHLDEFGFGEVNLILCLKHDRPTAAPTVSATVFIGPSGYAECALAPGDCVVFDGALTPHGRTPLGTGESVILISFGFRARDQALRGFPSAPPSPVSAQPQPN